MLPPCYYLCDVGGPTTPENEDVRGCEDGSVIIICRYQVPSLYFPIFFGGL